MRLGALIVALLIMAACADTGLSTELAQDSGPLVGDATFVPLATSVTEQSLPTDTPSPSATANPPITPASAAIPTATLTPTNTLTPTATLAPTNTPTPVATLSPTNTPTPMATLAPTNTPTPTNTPAPTPSPTPVPAGFTLSNPVLPGLSHTTAEGLSITVLSVNLDAWPDVQSGSIFNDPPAVGWRDVMVRVRVQNVGGSTTDVESASASDFRFVASAVLYGVFDHSCGLVIPDQIDAKLFLGGSVEGNVCAQLPVDEPGIVMLYEPLFSFDTSERRWLGLLSNVE